MLVSHSSHVMAVTARPRWRNRVFCGWLSEFELNQLYLLHLVSEGGFAEVLKAMSPITSAQSRKIGHTVVEYEFR